MNIYLIKHTELMKTLKNMFQKLFCREFCTEFHVSNEKRN